MLGFSFFYSISSTFLAIVLQNITRPLWHGVANKDLAVNTAVSVEGGAEGTQHWDGRSGRSDAPESMLSCPGWSDCVSNVGGWPRQSSRGMMWQMSGCSEWLVLFPQPGAEHDGGLICWVLLWSRCWAARWSNSKRWAGCITAGNRKRRLTGSLQRVEEHKPHIAWKEGQLEAMLE